MSIAETQLRDALKESAVTGAEDGIDTGMDNVIEEVFITDAGRIISADDMVRQVLAKNLGGLDEGRIHREVANSSLVDIAKNVEGSTQSREELQSETTLFGVQVVEPPYPPELMAMFLEVDETHFRCVKTKVNDSVARKWELEPTVKVLPEFEEEEEEVSSEDRSPLQQLEDTKVVKPLPTSIAKLKEKQLRHKESSSEEDVYTQTDIDVESLEVNRFIRDCNEIIGFEGTLERAAMDHEAIGWAAIEVIRGKDMKVKKITHLPAQRIKVLRGWKGFVEIQSCQENVNVAGGQVTYYQNFGAKVVSRSRKHPVSNRPLIYDPREDGELMAANARFDYVSRTTGKPTTDFNDSANEIIWIPKHHCSTIYYGFSDVVPALGAVLTNIHIRDFGLQFFEHNAVPRYAIIVEGARLSPKVVTAITAYFSEHVKGKAHKTLIIPVAAMRGEVRLRFEKLSQDNQESGFQETRKNNAQCILTAHGVSPAIVGIAETANLGSGKGLSQAETYKDRIVTPTQKRWEHVVNQLLGWGLGIRLVELRFNPLDIRDRGAEQKVLTAYLEKGILTINQVREKAGLGPPIDGGDRAFIMTPGGVVFVDELTEQMSAAIEEARMEVESIQEELTIRDEADAQAAAIEQSITDSN